MTRVWVFGVALVALAAPVTAQGFNPFGDNQVTTGAYRSAPARAARPPGAKPNAGAGIGISAPFLLGDDDDTTPPPPQSSQASRPPASPVSSDGGGRPSISGATPPVVAFRSSYGAGNIVIDSGGRALYYVLSSTQAYRYPVAVGREGFAWTGVERVSRKAEWPEWRPPAEMRQRVTNLPEVMSGGVRNPLGARAIYLGSTLYRIHGTNDSRSIGSASSSGCFRMANSHVVDLYSRVSSGATVHVVGRLPASVSRGVAENDVEDAPATAKKRKRASL
ncbi:MAG: L,D-transpeptidase [Hyphomicrobiaceae bacterium]